MLVGTRALHWTRFFPKLYPNKFQCFGRPVNFSTANKKCLGPEICKTGLHVLACKCFGTGTHLSGTRLHLFPARLSEYGTRNRWVPLACSSLQVLCQRDPFVRDPFAFISRKTFRIRDLKPSGSVCVFWLTSTLTTGPVRSGLVCIYFLQDIPGTGPKTNGSRLLILACRYFGNGTR